MGACVAATTHYAELKTFALTTDGVENASCEFDVKSLQPTYRLLTGIPGKSNAFAIAARLGLQPTIIERAKEQVSTEDARFEDVLAELERERRRVEQMKEEAQRMRSAAQSERDKMRAERDEQLSARRNSGAQTVRRQLELVLRAGRQRHRNTTRHLRQRLVAYKTRLRNQHLIAHVDNRTDGEHHRADPAPDAGARAQ